VDAVVFTEPELGSSYEQLVTAAQLAERLGWYGFFCADHYISPTQRPNPPGPVDAWTTLAGLARETSAIRLGTLMTCSTFRAPGPFSVIVAQVDAMSGGRIELGIGAGHFPAEHEAFGVAFPSIGERFDRLEEQLEILLGIAATPDGQDFDYQGKFYKLINNPALPKPAQKPYPRIIVGGRGPRRTPAIAARFAQEMNISYQAPAAAAESKRRVEQACADQGRDPATLDFSVTLLLCCGQTQEEVRRRLSIVERQMAKATVYRGLSDVMRFAAVGTPQAVIERIAAYRELGFSRVYLHYRDLPDLGQLELVAREVLPHLDAVTHERARSGRRT